MAEDFPSRQFLKSDHQIFKDFINVVFVNERQFSVKLREFRLSVALKSHL